MPLDSARVDVGDTATELTAADSDAVSGGSVVAMNRDGTNSVDLGASDVAFGEGFELAAGDQVSIDLAGGEQLFAIADATLTVRVDVLRSGV